MNKNTSNSIKESFEYEEAIKNAHDPKQKIRAFLMYRNYLLQFDTQKVLEVVDQGLKYAIEFGDEEDVLKLNTAKASALINLNHINEGFSLLFLCIEQAQKLNQKPILTILFGNLSNVFYTIGLHQTSLSIINYALQNYCSPEDFQSKYSFYNNMIRIYFNELNVLKFNDVFIQEIIDYYEGIKDFSNINYLYARFNLARYYRLSGRDDDALNLLTHLLELYQSQKMYFFLSDVYFEMGLIYKSQKLKTKMIFSFKEALKNYKKYHLRVVNLVIYQVLYEFYKEERDTTNALKYLEMYKEKEAVFRSERENKLKVMKMLGYDEILSIDSEIIKEYLKNTFFERHYRLIEENLKGEQIEILVDNIVYFSKSDTFLKLCLNNGHIIYLKTSFKDFVANIFHTIGDKHLFFETSSRSQMVNLFWLSKINYIKKEIVLKVLQNEYIISVSKRQLPLLRTIIEHNS